jgi:hypothetical protein
MRDQNKEEYLTKFIEEHCDAESIALMEKFVPYEFFCKLMKEVRRLGHPAGGIREEVNALSPPGSVPYPQTDAPACSADRIRAIPLMSAIGNSMARTLWNSDVSEEYKMMKRGP